MSIAIHYSYGGQLKIDLSKASADVHDRTVTVGACTPLHALEFRKNKPKAHHT
jgi:hypothetical protein